MGVTLRWVPDEAAAAALTCAVHGVLPVYPYPAPAAGVVYTPLSDAATRYWLLLVWQPHSRAAAWAPRLAETVHATYQGTWMP
ncbi:hypothetical protein [Streptomyces naganishii]|uniref:Uncharacterized protein n=1 Tax=Streptomyces naganishii JCM 4654 TaxID=1306179 RepID=A0A918Y0N2_9ACTN|nr:hypothetical protein [Streptomyces naganishii]GHD87051.1 hypothetical protein GCM10010508_17320 [Streptomyces naganishii JCM 4654]